jgi:hypothetical protein
LLSNDPQFTGGIVSSGSGWWSLGASEGIVINAWAGLGATWTCPNGSVGAVFQIDTATIMGVSDSVKWIGFSNGDTVLIAKELGLGKAALLSENATPRILIGISGGTELGSQLPTVLDLFDYQAGDALQYLVEGNWTDGQQICYIYGRMKYEILGRTTYADSIVYDAQVIRSIDQTCYAVFNPQPTDPTRTRDVTPLTFTIKALDQTENNPFNAYWDMHLWPNALGQVASVMGGAGGNTITHFRLDDEHRNVVEQSGFQLDSPWNNTLYCQSVEEDTVSIHNTYTTYGTSFTEGIGMTKENLFYFEGGQDRTLEGWLINGVQTGWITSTSALLAVDEFVMNNGLQLSPNPAWDRIELSSAKPLGRIWITDMQGRQITSTASNASATFVDVRSLPPGPYVLRADGFAPQRLVIAR